VPPAVARGGGDGSGGGMWDGRRRRRRDGASAVARRCRPCGGTGCGGSRETEPQLSGFDNENVGRVHERHIFDANGLSLEAEWERAESLRRASEHYLRLHVEPPGSMAGELGARCRAWSRMRDRRVPL